MYLPTTCSQPQDRLTRIGRPVDAHGTIWRDYGIQVGYEAVEQEILPLVFVIVLVPFEPSIRPPLRLDLPISFNMGSKDN